MTDFDSGFAAGADNPETGFYCNPHLVSGPPARTLEWWRGFDRARTEARRAERLAQQESRHRIQRRPQRRRFRD